MRVSQLFNQTLRKSSDQNDDTGHQFLIQAGYLRPLASGIFGYLPLAQRTLAHISKIIREEMDVIGGQEVSLQLYTLQRSGRKPGAGIPSMRKWADSRTATGVIWY